MIKPTLIGSAIALAVFAVGYFVVGLDPSTSYYFGAVGLLGFQSVIIGGLWWACLCRSVEKRRQRN